MLRYRSIRLEGIAYFDEAELDLDWSGTTFVAGINRNSKSPGRRNGVGKSLLLYPLAHLAFGDPAGLPRSLVRHALLTGPGSSLTWELSARGHDWTIVKRRVRGRTGRVEWSVSRDGSDLKVRTSTAAEKLVSRLLPFNEEEFRTLVYIDSRMPSPLLAGSSAARQNHLAGLLRVDEFDKVRELVRDRLADLDGLAARRDALSDAVSDLGSPDPDRAKRMWARARKALDLAKSERDDLRRRLAARVLYETHREDLELSREFDPAEHRRLADQERAMLRDVRAQVEYDDYVKNRKQWLAGLQVRRRKLRGGGAGHLASSEPAEWKVELPRAVAQLRNEADSSGRLAELREKRSQYDKARRRQGVRSPRRVLDELQERLARYESEYVPRRDQIERLRAHIASGSAECLVCGSNLSRAEARRQMAGLEMDNRKLDRILSRDRAARDAAAGLVNMWTDQDRKDLVRLKDTRSQEDIRSDMADVQSLEDHLRRKPRPRPRPSAAVDGGTLDGIKDRLAEMDGPFRAHLRVKAVRKQADDGAAYAESSRLKADLDAASRRVDRLAARVDVLRVEAGRAADDSRRRRRMHTRMRKLDASLEDRPVLSRLSDAYGGRGLRMVVLREAADRICGNINRFAPLLFPERMEFAVDVSEGRLDISVSRSDGRTSDVRHMSGAESRIFSLVWLLGVLPLVPESRRANLVVLDEFEANLDGATRELLLDEYLPALNRVVEHVVFVTPNDPPEPGHGRRVVTVEKDGSRSRLVRDAG